MSTPGGLPIQDPVTKQWNLFHAQMLNHCGLGSWSQSKNRMCNWPILKLTCASMLLYLVLELRQEGPEWPQLMD